MTITPEERQLWREVESSYSLDKRTIRLLGALEKAESERDAYIRETGKYARECGLQDAEIGRLKDRAEKAERERDALVNLLAETDCVSCALGPYYDIAFCNGSSNIKNCKETIRAYAAQKAAKQGEKE